MMNQLYLECNAGISGDMMVAALLDLYGNSDHLKSVLHTIPVEGFSVEISRVKKGGLDCSDFNVILDKEHENHDHDMEYLHGHHHEHHGEDHHHHEEEHHHEGEHHHHGDEHRHHSHVHRGMAEVTDIIQRTQMTENARAIALKIFGIIGEAEAKAHGVSVDQVHFHEVGAVDSIVDVISVAVCLDDLNVEQVIIPKLCEGTGTVRCQHGVLPIPVPAVANIIEKYGLNLEIMDVKGEFVTPTGAAIAAAIQTANQLPDPFRIKKIGMGAGKRTYERPSILRAMLIETPEEISPQKDYIYKLESNIDDCTGEALGYVMEQLLEAGARDVHYHPVYMKKNRPAWQLNVICCEEDIPKLEQIIFRETTTIGIRRIAMERSVLPREKKTVETKYGKAEVKVCVLEEEIRCYPEYESVVGICKEKGLSYQEVYREIIRVCEEQ